MKNTKKRGFTIVELVIVIAVIAILASVLIPTFSNVVNAAKKSKALQEARNAYTEALVAHLEEKDDATCSHPNVNGWAVVFTPGTDGAETVTLTKVMDKKEYKFTVTNGAFNTEPVITPKTGE